MDRILIILKKENGPRASSAPALGLNTIMQISGERLQDHWSSGFFISSFKLVNNVKTFLPYHHKNGLKIFACYQLRDFSAHEPEHFPGYKTAFPMPRAHWLEIFQNNAHDSNLG